MAAYLGDKFGDQFVQLVNETHQGIVDERRKQKFKKNLEFLKMSRLELPDCNKYPF